MNFIRLEDHFLSLEVANNLSDENQVSKKKYSLARMKLSKRQFHLLYTRKPSLMPMFVYANEFHPFKRSSKKLHGFFTYGPSTNCLHTVALSRENFYSGCRCDQVHTTHHANITFVTRCIPHTMQT